jgi:phosphatidylglycerol---prolipoprotein diacylglyceryl transferase
VNPPLLFASLPPPHGTGAHWLLEVLAFAVGGMLYWRRRNAATQPPELLTRWGLLAGAALGAALGSRLLYMLQYWLVLQSQPAIAWFSGKTVVGGLLGGWLGVEISKKLSGWRESTGDGFVWPLVVALLLGRLGCQLAGLEDLTYGNPTGTAWGWDYGDHVPRHPVALYEMAGVLLLAGVIHLQGAPARRGGRFRLFMAGYLLLRLLLDFLKPPFGAAAPGLLAPGAALGLTPIQWVCIAGLLYHAVERSRWLAKQRQGIA